MYFQVMSFIVNWLIRWSSCFKEQIEQLLCLLILLCRVEDGKHSQEVSQFQQELAEARSQLQVLQKNLDDKLSEQPLVSQEVKSEHLTVFICIAIALYDFVFNSAYLIKLC